MTSAVATPLPAPAVREPWRSPIDIEAYDRNANLTEAERQELVGLVTNPHHAWWMTPLRAQILARLVRPISDVAAATHARRSVRAGLIKLVLLETGRCNMSFRGWSQEDWHRILRPNYELFVRRYGNGGGNAQGSRLHLFALAYLCRRIDSFRAFGRFEPTNLARRVFGEDRVNDSLTRASDLAVSGATGGIMSRDAFDQDWPKPFWTIAARTLRI